METKKREIAHKKRASQIISFDGLEKGNCSFTDLDGMCEIDNKYLIMTEAKLVGKEVPIAQRLLMERLTDWAPTAGVSFIVEHDTNSDEEVRLVDCLVREVRLSEGKWEKFSQLKRHPLGRWLLKFESEWKTRKLIDTYNQRFFYCGYEE
jgi:hypothetical protein